MKRSDIPEMEKAIDYLDEHWPKGHKDRGEAMVLLALAQIGGRAEQKFLEEKWKEKC